MNVFCLRSENGIRLQNKTVVCWFIYDQQMALGAVRVSMARTVFLKLLKRQIYESHNIGSCFASLDQ